MSDEITLEDFREYFPYAPTALCIKECIRLKVARALSCPAPILDVGCGDGLFAKLAFRDAEVWGIDIDANEGRRAQASRAYGQIILADVTSARLPERFFGSCVANCSLEHIPELHLALVNILKALRPGAPLYTFVPNRDWAGYMHSTLTLKRLGLERAATAIESAINTVFKHHHLDDARGWRRRFEAAGYVVDRVDPVGSTASTRAFEAFLLPSLIGWVNKKLTGRWALASELRKLAFVPAFAMVEGALALGADESPTAEFLVACHRPQEPSAGAAG
jgi:SAM-dependent methyltransferase